MNASIWICKICTVNLKMRTKHTTWIINALMVSWQNVKSQDCHTAIHIEAGQKANFRPYITESIPSGHHRLENNKISAKSRLHSWWDMWTYSIIFSSHWLDRTKCLRAISPENGLLFSNLLHTDKEFRHRYHVGVCSHTQTTLVPTLYHLEVSAQINSLPAKNNNQSDAAI